MKCLVKLGDFKERYEKELEKVSNDEWKILGYAGISIDTNVYVEMRIVAVYGKVQYDVSWRKCRYGEVLKEERIDNPYGVLEFDDEDTGISYELIVSDDMDATNEKEAA